MLNEGSLNLGGGQTVTTNVDDIIDTAADPVEALLVTGSTVTSELEAVLATSVTLHAKLSTHVKTLVDVEVGVHVALVCAVDAARHARPSLLEGQNTLNVVAVQLLARNGIDNGRLNAKEGQRGTTGLGRRNTSQRSNNIRAGLSLPVSLHYKG